MWLSVASSFLGIFSAGLFLRAETVASRTLEARETLRGLRSALPQLEAGDSDPLAAARAVFSADARRDRVIASRYRRWGASFLLAAFLLLLLQSLLSLAAPA